MLNALPNETIRLSTRNLTQSGSVTYGAGALAVKNNSYEVIVDYAKYTTTYLRITITSTSTDDSGKFKAGVEDIIFETEQGRVESTVNTRPPSKSDTAPDAIPLRSSASKVVLHIPIYVGVGLRIIANVQVLDSNVQLNLFGLGAAASAGKATGTMVVQTLGINGSPISPLIPLPSDISQSSIQSAMQSLASIKTKLYDPMVGIRPQLIGFETWLSKPEYLELIQATIEGASATAEMTPGRELLATLVNDCK